MWENNSESNRKKCQEKALQGCLIVCGVVAPKAKEELFQAPCQPIQNESENAVIGELLVAMTSYRDAPFKSIKMQLVHL